MPSAVLAPTYGDPAVLELRDIPTPEPGPGQVVVEVRAAALNPADHKRFGGAWGEDPDALPLRIGWEAAGVVIAVGDGDVTGPTGELRVGDEVIAYGPAGAQATHLALDAGDVLHKPSSLSFEAASGLMLTGVTAVHLLEATKVGRGDTILVHGASGGVGLALVQLAVARGASVVGTASESAFLTLRGYNTRPVAYGDGLLERVRDLAPAGYDAALDCVGTDEAIDVSLTVVDDRDRIASIAAFGRAEADGFQVLDGSGDGAEIRSAARTQLLAAVEARDLEVVVDRTFPLAEAAAAHAHQREGSPRGKVVLVP
ncbi:NADP-dependent oxidoreductase [Nocardioidaceae bacterium]|nr:NADP-dependent oxidoreductase [Nocardioidaceae bacterium]